MRPIPPKLKQEMANDPYYSKCARAEDGGCNGRITFEHTIIYASHQLNKKWAIIPLCTFHHAVCEHQDGGDLNKQRNVQIALNRATDDELRQISKAIDYLALKQRLNA